MSNLSLNLGRKSKAALLASAIAIPAEGIRQYAYYDPPGILTVCYGSTTNVVKGVKYSLEECKKRLDTDMSIAIEAVEKCVPGLPINVLAAFADAVYNMGSTIACNKTKSTAARYLYQGKLLEACKQLPRWNKANVGGFMIELPGLTKRRNVEMTVCMDGLQQL